MGKKLGKVKLYSKQKGYGIVTSDKVDYFFRYTDIIGKSHRECYAGEKVSFIPQNHVRGLRALEVKAI